jgi:anti-anti-sigma factor
VKTASGPAGAVTRHAADELARHERPAACGHQRVDDYYCSRGTPFFAAVISTCNPLPPATCAQHDPRGWPTLLTLVGDLDRATAPLLHACVARIDGNVEIDCSGLDFVGVQGLRALADARARCERADATCELVAPTPMLRRLLLIADAIDS